MDCRAATAARNDAGKLFARPDFLLRDRASILRDWFSIGCDWAEQLTAPHRVLARPHTRPPPRPCERERSEARSNPEKTTRLIHCAQKMDCHAAPAARNDAGKLFARPGFFLLRERATALTRGPHARALTLFYCANGQQPLRATLTREPSRVAFIKPCKAAIGEHNLTVVFQAMALGGGG